MTNEELYRENCDDFYKMNKTKFLKACEAKDKEISELKILLQRAIVFLEEAKQMKQLLKVHLDCMNRNNEVYGYLYKNTMRLADPERFNVRFNGGLR